MLLTHKYKDDSVDLFTSHSFQNKSQRGSPHVNLVESGEHGAGALSLLQPLGDPQPHTVHLHLDRRREKKQPQVSGLVYH